MKEKIEKSNVLEILELNAIQKGMLYHFLKESDENLYNVQLSFRIEGDLNVDLLKESLSIVRSRNEVLRSVFRWEEVSKPIQIILKDCPADFKVHDLSLLFADEAQKLKNKYIDDDRKSRFDLEKFPMKFCVIKEAEDLFFFNVTYHHILYDGWSNGILFHELFRCYNDLNKGRSPELGLKPSYKKAVLGSQKNIDSEEKQHFWADYLKDYEIKAHFDSILHHSRDKSQEVKKLRISTDTLILDGFVKTHRVTKAAIIYATYGLLLQKYNAVTDIVFGATASNRDSSVVGNEVIIGNFINSIPFRLNVQEDISLLELVIQVNQDLIRRNPYHNSSLHEINQLLELPANENLFESVLGIENYPLDEEQIKNVEGLDIKLDAVYENTNATLVVLAFFNEKLELEFNYKTGILTDEFIRLFSAHFIDIVQQILENSGRSVKTLSLLHKEEEAQILHDFNSQPVDFPHDKTIVDLFEEQVDLCPDKVVVLQGKRSFNYRDLNARANQLARFLQGRQIGENDIVGLSIGPCAEMMIGILGILKSGAAYLPLNPDLPSLRVMEICKDVKCRLILTENDCLKEIDQSISQVAIAQLDAAGVSEENLSLQLNSGKLVYVIYTSGTTGTPKGVMISHRNLVNYVHWLKDFIQLEAADKTALTTSFAFDLGYTGIFPALLFGAELHLLPKEIYTSTATFLSYVAEHRISYLKLTPSFYSTIIEHPDFEKMACLRVILLGGERISADAIEKTGQSLPHIKMINHYGPTETTIGSIARYISSAELPDFKMRPSIGKPIRNTRCYILDANRNLVPVGMKGELYIGGEGVGLGYLGQEALTNERFVANPFADHEKIYKTGDLARWMQDGNIEFLGRMDHQVKIRGYRVEPQEIEHQLLKYEGLKEALIIVKNDDQEQQLLAYYLSNETIGDSKLKTFLSERLPEYMVPSYFIHLKEWPLNDNGKLNKKALPQAEINLQPAYQTPINETEEKLLKIWCLVLNKETVSVTSSFLELGGHSLKIILMLNRVYKEFNVLVPINEMFKLHTIRNLAHYLSAQQQSAYVPMEMTAIAEYYPLSFPQRRLYFLYEFDKLSTAYNGAFITMLSGALDFSRMDQAFRTLIDRYEVLRTSFAMEDGHPVQKIAESVDFCIERFQSDERAAHSVLQQFVRPFDLEKPSLMRVGLIELSPSEHILIVDVHHIIGDGVSQEILIKNFMAIYNGETLPPLKLHYKDYAAWQAGGLQQKKIAGQKDFWRNEFKEMPEPIELPIDFSRPVINSYEGGKLDFRIGTEETEKIKKLAEREGVTMFMMVLAIYNILLSKISNQEDITIGTAVSGRDHPDIEEGIGMFVNTLPLRNYPVGELKFKEFLKDLKIRTLRGMDHQAYPYEELLDELKVERNTSRNPLFDVMFTYQSFKESELQIPGLILSAFQTEHVVSKFDMTLIAFEKKGEILLSFEYSTRLFKRESLERYADYFKKILTSILADEEVQLSHLDMLSEKERNQLLMEFNDTQTDYPVAATMVSLFKDKVNQVPAQVALKIGQEQMSYRELAERSDAIAGLIQEVLKGESGHRIGLLFNYSLDMAASILAVIKSGCAFVPLSPDHPEHRNRYILSDCEAKLLLVADKIYEGVQAAAFGMDNDLVISIGKDNPSPGNAVFQEVQVAAEDPVYVIYTSGTTGQPKGVEISHKNLVNYTLWRISFHGLKEEDCTLQLVPYYFDGFGSNFYAALLSGGTLIMIGEEKKFDAHYIAEVISAEQVSNFAVLPRLYAEVLEALAVQTADINLRFVVLAGEQTNRKLIERSLELLPAINLENEYGPTEATIGATHNGLLNADHTSVIGRPISNTSVYVLGKNRELLPVGVKGELCISGRGLSKGYLNNEGLTKEKFIPHPFVANERLYRTGDLGRWLTNGNLEIFGRVDSQVKIRGFRLELAEIESQLSLHPLLKECVVVVAEKAEHPYLVAYCVADKEIDANELKVFLATFLPDYMVPSFYVFLKELPFTAVGKLDRKALPELKMEALRSLPPKTAAEKLLVEVWSKVIGMENIGITDNFFAIGGDSIKSIQISSRMRTAGYELTVKDIFTHQTIQDLAIKLKPIVRVSDQSEVIGEAVLTPIQRWFFKSSIVNKQHFNQAVMLSFPDGITEESVRTIFEKLQEHHDALRMTFRTAGGETSQVNAGKYLPLALSVTDLRKDDDAESTMSAVVQKLQSEMNLNTGPLMKLGLFQLESGSRLLVVIHHMIIDGVSWRILFEDMDSLYHQLRSGESLGLPLKTDSFLSWSRQLLSYTKSERFESAVAYWASHDPAACFDLPKDFHQAENKVADVKQEKLLLSKDLTRKLLTEVHHPFNTQINDILLAALLIAAKKQYGAAQVLIDVESHGRETLGLGENISRTIGWFTSIYPVLLKINRTDFATVVKEVKEQLRSVPNNGLDYLLNKYMISTDLPEEEDRSKQSRISFNYLGNFDADLDGKIYAIAAEGTGDHISTEETRLYDLEFSALVTKGQLSLSLSYGKHQFREETIASFMAVYQQSLEEIIDSCCNYDIKELTLSDLTYKDLVAEQLDELQNLYQIDDIYPLSAMQEGLLFHALLDPESENYFEQMTVELKGDLDPEIIQKTMNDLIARYGILRTLFIPEGYGKSIQVVLKERSIDFRYEDIRYACIEQGKEGLIEDYRLKQRAEKFDLNSDVLIRLWVLKTGQDEYELIWAHHHIIMDGWCMGIMLREFRELYAKNKRGDGIILPGVQPYSTYISWLEDRNKKEARDYWTAYLSGYDALATLPKQEHMSSERLGYEHTVYVHKINPDQTRLLQEITTASGATINTILQSAWAILLSRYNHTEDVVFGAVVSGRPTEIQGIESMVGLFINTIPVRIRCKETSTIASLLQEVQQSYLDSEQYSYHPLSEIQALSLPGRGLLDHIMIFENYPIEESILHQDSGAGEIRDFVITGVQAFEQNNYDLWLSVVPGETISIKFNYNANVYSNELIQQLSRQFSHLMTQFTSGTDLLLSEIGIMTDEDQDLVLHSFNDTECVYEDKDTLVSLFERQVQLSADEVAVVFEGETLSYKELNRCANQLGEHLRVAHHCKPDHLIAIMCERSELMMIGLLGILKSGAAYVPIDPSYPKERIEYILNDCGADVLLTGKVVPEDLKFNGAVIPIRQFRNGGLETLSLINTPDNLCYVIYTSGSTGKPKGVMISHRNVLNFFAGMSQRLPLHAEDSILAVTSISFDISVLELFWTLCQGVQVVIHPSDGSLTDLNRYLGIQEPEMDFSLFFFSSYNPADEDKYHLLLEAVKYADAEDFNAVWVPERHFHEFGGLFPNPSVVSAALAMVTKKIELRSGSIVSPLHDPIRIAEDWSVVDNLSRGRVGLSFAPGWNPNDFVLSRGDFKDRHAMMYQQIEEVRKLWKGESISRKNGLGQDVDLRVFPAPIQKELPVWVTAARNEETFISAGAIGANVLTHFLGQDLEELAGKIKLYRASRVQNGYPADTGKVAVMLHTYIGEDINEVEKLVEGPFMEYLKSSVGLGKILLEEGGLKENSLSEEDEQMILKNAFKRYYKTSSLIGTKKSCAKMVQQLKAIGVDEIACLVDFGIDENNVLKGLENLQEMKALFSGKVKYTPLHRPVTLLQSTPSFIRLLEADEPGSGKFLASLRLMMIGGEAVPAALIDRIKQDYAAEIYNMYGPTESTIWSSVFKFEKPVDQVSIGKPISNTQIYILDAKLRILPPGITGDMYIGGKGLSRGYWRRPDLTAERFIANPFKEGELIYKTGDLAKWLPDGNIVMMGREDHQVKIRGYRIELEEIESGIMAFENIREAVVLARNEKEGAGKYLVGYLVSAENIDMTFLRAFLHDKLPEYMIPGIFVQLDELPLTPNGKIDRNALPDPEFTIDDSYKAACGEVEEKLLEIWADLLKIDKAVISVNKSFFEIGGHSLNATALVSRIFKEFNVKMLLQRIFVINSIELIAEYIENEKWVKKETADQIESEFILD